jgi:hypothetical protein
MGRVDTAPARPRKPRGSPAGSIVAGVFAIVLVAGIAFEAGRRSRYVIATGVPVSGTLVVSLPTRDGLVIGADSRATAGGEYFDSEQKLCLVETKPPVVFTITGTSDFLDQPPSGVSIRDWFPRAPFRFRGSDVVETAIWNAPAAEDPLSRLTVGASALASSLGQYFSRVPAAGALFRGRDVCQLVVAGSQNAALACASVVIVEHENGSVVVEAPNLRVYQSDSSVIADLFGESEYVLTHVLQGPGSLRLPVLVRGILNDPPRVWELGGREGVLSVRAIIQASEAMTSVVPVPSGNGIGGPVQGYLVTGTSVRSLADVLKVEN